MHIIQHRLWERLEHEHDACHFLGRRCIICSFQFSRCQELHQHYRLQHPELWEYAPQKAIQLTNLYSRETPCACCGSLFLTHMCPVWSQISVLLVNGAGVDHPEVQPQAPDHRRCELCLQCFVDTATLVQHLQADHGLQGLSFNASRDSLDNSTACSHCGSVFQTMSGLKSHIVQGRCAFFNPQASSETMEVAPQWREACLDGKFLEVLRPCNNRMRLTVACQACGKGCQRAADLALHLQTAHARLWRLSTRLTMILVEAYYQYQCFCNPTLGIKRGHHVCLPFRQLAMCFHRLGTEPFAPTVITDQVLQSIFATALPRAPKYRLEQALVRRTFSDLWQDPELRQLMSTQCLTCGALHAPADLALHLREEHQCKNSMFLFYMEQLLPVLHALNPDDFQCQFCQQIFNLPGHMRPHETADVRLALAQSHFRGSCPVLIQVSLLFAALLNGGPLQDGTGRPVGVGPDDGRIWRTGSASQGQDVEAGSQSATGKGATDRRSKQPRRRRSGPGHGAQGALSASAVAHHGATADPPRSGIAVAPKNGSIHSFFEPRASGCTSALDPGDRSMETTSGDFIQADNAIAATLDADPPEESAHSGWQPDGMQGHGPALCHLSGDRSDTGRSELPIPSLGPGDTESHPGQEEPSERTEDAPTCGGAFGDDAGPRACDPLSLFEGTGAEKLTGHSMAAPTEHSQRPPLRADVPLSPQRHLDADWGYNETTYVVSDSDGNGGAADDRAVEGPRQGQGQAGTALESLLTDEKRGLMISSFCTMVLLNDTNWCYANSAVHGLIWTLLCLQIQSEMIWGPHFAELWTFMQHVAATPVLLADQAWFQTAMCIWGMTPGQRDCVECAQHLLTWLASPAFDMRWEQRLERAEGILLADSNSCFTPITLNISAAMHDAGHGTLSSMILDWSQEHAMHKALLHAAPCLCLHVDRYFQSSEGTISKSECQISLDQAIHFPVFLARDMKYETVTYVPVAGVIHQGQDCAGHYRTLLRMQPTVIQSSGAASWLLTDDGHVPEPLWQIPTWCQRGLTVIWLLRIDCVSLPNYPAAGHRLMAQRAALADTGTGTMTERALLQLLTAQPDITETTSDRNHELSG